MTAQALGCMLAIGLLNPMPLAAQSKPPPPDPMPLEWAVAEALINYPSMRAARAGLEGAEAGGRAARSAWWPQLSFSGHTTRFQLPMLVRPLHELDANQIQFDPTLIQGNLFLDFLLLDGGARRSHIRQADALAQGSAARVEVTQMGVIQGTVTAFLQVQTLRQVLAAETARLNAFAEERNRATLFFEAGRAPEIEMLRAEAALSQARADIASTEAILRAAEDLLGRVIGIEGTTVSQLQLAEVEPDPGAGRTDIAADSIHPVLLQAWSEVTRAEAIHSESKAKWIPNLGLSAGMRQYGDGSFDFTNEWQVGLVLSYPLFTGFRRSRETARTDALLVAAREEYRLKRFDVEQELDEARAALTEADARVRALEQAVTQFREVARIEALALDAGAGVQRDFLDAQAALFQSQASLARARHGRVIARVREASALGHLDTLWIENNLESMP